MFHLGLGCNRHPMPGGHYPLQYILGDTPSLIYLDSSCYLLVPVVVASLSWPLAQVFCAAPEKVLPMDSVETVMLKMAVPLSFSLPGPYITLGPLPGKCRSSPFVLLGILENCTGKPHRPDPPATQTCAQPTMRQCRGLELWFLGHCPRAHLWPGDKLPQMAHLLTSGSPPQVQEFACLY